MDNIKSNKSKKQRKKTILTDEVKRKFEKDFEEKRRTIRNFLNETSPDLSFVQLMKLIAPRPNKEELNHFSDSSESSCNSRSKKLKLSKINDIKTQQNAHPVSVYNKNSSDNNDSRQKKDKPNNSIESPTNSESADQEPYCDSLRLQKKQKTNGMLTTTIESTNGNIKLTERKNQQYQFDKTNGILPRIIRSNDENRDSTDSENKNRQHQYAKDIRKIKKKKINGIIRKTIRSTDEKENSTDSESKDRHHQYAKDISKIKKKKINGIISRTISTDENGKSTDSESKDRQHQHAEDISKIKKKKMNGIIPRTIRSTDEKGNSTDSESKDRQHQYPKNRSKIKKKKRSVNENVNSTKSESESKQQNCDKYICKKKNKRKNGIVTTCNKFTEINIDNEKLTPSTNSIESETMSNTKVHKTLWSIYEIDDIKTLPDYERISKILSSDAPEKRIVLKKEVTFWNTYSYLIKEMEKCVLQNDWKNFTRYLILFTDAPKKYEPFILKACIINFIYNPHSNEEFLTQFLQQCIPCANESDINKTLTALFHVPKMKETDDT